MPKFNDITGQSFNLLTAKHVAGRKGSRIIWDFDCACGGTLRCESTRVVSGHTTSCGCVRSATCATRNRKHGEATRKAQTKEYRTWAAMIRRCRDTGFTQYADYGGRGITVCERWADSFDAFLADMGRAPSPRHTIDRTDNSRGYEPGNCRWATYKEQAQNSRHNHLITFNGKTLTLYQWAAETGINYVTILSRIGRLGWSVEQALTTPVKT